MKKTLSVLAIMVGFTTFGNTAHADEAKPTVLIIGDSITARGNDVVGSADRGWWSYVAKASNRVPVTNAIAGSGMLMRASCKSTTFGERLTDIATTKADTVIVAGGRNDFKTCKNGKSVRATKAQSTKAVKTFMHDLAKSVKSAGILKRTYVMTPWGTKYITEYKFIKPLVKKWALHYGLNYVDVGVLSNSYTVDKTHPNEAGNKLLAKRVLRRSNIA